MENVTFSDDNLMGLYSNYIVNVNSQDVSSLSEAQDIALSLIPIMSGFLSACGSATIIHMVLTCSKKTSYRRILLGLSMSDLVSSLVLPLQPFLSPSDTSQRIWAIGNDKSCSAMGFFQQLSLANVWYNGVLSFYFLLVVKFGVREIDMARRYEPLMHVCAVGYPFITASIGAGMGVYDEMTVGHGCWITNYPKGCGCTEEGEEDNVCCVSPVIAWIFGGIPTLVAIVVVLFNNLLVYCHVRNTLQRSRMYLKEYRSSAMRAGAMRGSTIRRRLTSAMRKSTVSDAQTQRIQAVAVQAFLYVAVFITLLTPTTVLRILESQNALFAKDEAKYFPLLLLQSILWPMQGIFNLILYIRPSYLKTRIDFPNESRFWAVRRALHGAKIQPTDEAQEEEEEGGAAAAAAEEALSRTFVRSARNSVAGSGNSANQGKTPIHTTSDTALGASTTSLGPQPTTYITTESEVETEKQRKFSVMGLTDISPEDGG